MRVPALVGFPGLGALLIMVPLGPEGVAAAPRPEETAEPTVRLDTSTTAPARQVDTATLELAPPVLAPPVLAPLEVRPRSLPEAGRGRGESNPRPSEEATSRGAQERRSPRIDPRLAAGDQWPAGRVDDQMDRDETMIPFGKGAIFVPAMTSGLDEPPVEILSNDERVAEGTTGERVVLSPGTYTVRVGSGASQQRIRVQATVRELATTVIPASWSGLTVHVVDENYGSLRASYELIRVEDREYMGIGFGTDEQAGEPVSTWILQPGLYKIVRVGENYRARRDFVTVRLLKGKHTHFLLVLDEETGEFAGGGEVPAEELFRPQEGFFGSLVIGGDVTMNIRNDVLGLQDGVSLAARGFIDGRLSVELLGNPLILQLQLEQGFTNTPDAPIQKTIDRLDLDALYVYRFEPWVGPYLRLGAETNLIPGEQQLGDDFFVVRRREDGSVITRTGPQSSVELSPSFGLTSVREGIGLNVRAFKTVFAELNIRAGFGARHRITRSLFELDPCSRSADGSGQPTAECSVFDDPGGRTLVFQEVVGNDQLGAETAVLATIRITRYILVNLEVDSLLTAPLANSIIEGEGSVALKLASFLSVNYVTRYTRDPTLSEESPDRVEQDILLRFSVDLL